MAIRLPQARDFDRLRHMLALIATGEQTPEILGQKMGAGRKYAARHAHYYREAAEILGLVERRRWSLTARGRGLLATEAMSDEERDLLRAAVADAVELGEIRSALLRPEEPSVEVLVEYALGHVARGTRETIQRRVKDTLSWRARLGTAEEIRRRRLQETNSPTTREARLSEREPSVESGDWPDPKALPFNWPPHEASVEQVVYEDLRGSGEVLLNMGYASLQHLCDFVATADVPQRIRVGFGTEPFVGRDVVERHDDDDLEQRVRDYWLERGISVLHALSVLKTIDALKVGRLESRISRGSHGLHAKMFLGEKAVTIGSSNFTSPGLRTQLEANVRITEVARRAEFDQAWQLGEIYWRLARPFDVELRDLLEQLLRKVTWKEALARACAELLEGQWAKKYLRDELGHSGKLWPSQVQGIGQALYVLMEVGSVLIADATGSGKTKAGAWLLRALRERLVAMGRPIADPVVVSPPAVSERWATELHDAEVRIEVHSQGALSSGRAAAHPRVVRDVETSRILGLDEAHNFINPSNRTALVNTNLADHVVLFTATPINRDVSDLLGIAELLGADNLDDETLRILEETGWRRRRSLTGEDRARLRQAVKRFTVRRTKQNFNALIDREPNRYRNEHGEHCRYPNHRARYYRLHESKHDRHLAREITRLARSLRGLVMLKEPIRLAKAHQELGWTAERFVAIRLKSAKALALYQVRAALRSSRAALWEHVHGTRDAGKRYRVRTLDKEEAGQMLAKLARARDRGPPKSELTAFLPDWLTDRASFRRACEEESAAYGAISELCDQLSDGRERAKVERVLKLLDEHDLVVAFDSRPITLFLLREMLGQVDFEIFVATGGRPTDQRRVLKAFGLDAVTRTALALCSNAMSEGINLQKASAVLHLDMPSVVRIAEQRVGRIDRMDSPHGDVESWWPQDAEEFALSSDEKLGARLELVGDILGSNLELPEEEGKEEGPAIVRALDLVNEMADQEARQLELLDDAFAPVRAFVEGPAALVEPKVYSAIRYSKARVVSAVAAVRSSTRWAFITLPGTEHVAPRWVFVDGAAATVATALDEVADHLRERLEGAEDVELDEHAIEVLRELLRQVQTAAASLLPRRKQRALQQMRHVLSSYRNDAERRRNHGRVRLVHQLLALTEPNERVDLDNLVDAWLAAIRPRWRAALRAENGRRRRSTLRRLDGLTVELEENPLTSDELTSILKAIDFTPPLAERVVAVIIGVPP